MTPMPPAAKPAAQRALLLALKAYIVVMALELVALPPLLRFEGPESLVVEIYRHGLRAFAKPDPWISTAVLVGLGTLAGYVATRVAESRHPRRPGA